MNTLEQRIRKNKASLVKAHRYGHWELARKLSQQKERLKRARERYGKCSMGCGIAVTRRGRPCRLCSIKAKRALVKVILTRLALQQSTMAYAARQFLNLFNQIRHDAAILQALIYPRPRALRESSETLSFIQYLREQFAREQQHYHRLLINDLNQIQYNTDILKLLCTSKSFSPAIGQPARFPIGSPNAVCFAADGATGNGKSSPINSRQPGILYEH